MALPFILEILNKVRKLQSEPIGIVRPWPSDAAPTKWLECDGSALESSDFPQLFAVIGTRFGDGTTGIGTTGSTDFNLPDLRGQFIRGYDNGAGNDPDAATRGDGSSQGGSGKPGQATGDAIGSIQKHTVKPHTHVIPYNYAGLAAAFGSSGANPLIGDTGLTGSESRPRNISMMYIIRV